jgi:hypothetical protein
MDGFMGVGVGIGTVWQPHPHPHPHPQVIEDGISKSELDSNQLILLRA